MCTVVSGQDACSIDISKRQKCGTSNISSYKCEQANCCYDESKKECYFSTQSTPKYSEWSNWTTCTTSCGGGGTQKRERSCLYASGTLAPQGMCLVGKSIESKMCNTHKCGEEKPTEIICEEDNNFCSGKRSQCGGSVELRQKCPITCGFCRQDIKEPCEDVSGTCSQAPELCLRGFLSTQFRKWCKKTCGLCGDSGSSGDNTPLILTTKEPTMQVTAVITTSEYKPKYPLMQCIDEFDTCFRVEGWCDEMKHRREMTLYCRRTCNLCFTLPRATEFGKYATTIAPPVVLTTTTKEVTTTPKSTISTPVVLTTTTKNVTTTPKSTIVTPQLLTTTTKKVTTAPKSTIASQVVLTTTTKEVTTTLKSTSAPKSVFSVAATASISSGGKCVDNYNHLTCSKWKRICIYSTTARKGCKKTCGLCTVTGGSVKSTTKKPVTNVVTTTLKTTTKPTTFEQTTREIVTTTQTTTVQSTERNITSSSTLQCIDTYKQCDKLVDHCNTRTYENILSKHCRYTCNIDNCRGR